MSRIQEQLKELKTDSRYDMDHATLEAAVMPYLLSSPSGEPLDRAGFREALSWAEVNDGMADRYFKVFDYRQNGTIDFQEFAAGLAMLSSGSIDQKLELIFRLYDLKENGVISRGEMTKAMRDAAAALYKMIYEQQLEQTHDKDVAKQRASLAVPLTAPGAVEAQVDKAFGRMDIVKDGVISFAEFVEVVKSDPAVLDVLRQFDKQVALDFYVREAKTHDLLGTSPPP